MYEAELRGKLSTNLQTSEDILTSNVFSFFKYSDRKVFLQQYLHQLGIDVSRQDVKSAQFIFWPRFDDQTEPDLVLIVGNYYILVEAKYSSSFGKDFDFIALLHHVNFKRGWGFIYKIVFFRPQMAGGTPAP
jgi:hypothetical protein